MHAFTRYELAAALANRFKLSETLAREIVEELLLQMSVQLIQGRRIEFRGFGVLEPRTLKARIGRNPKATATSYIIPQRKTVKFKPGKVLNAELNPGEPAAPSP